MTPLRTLIVLLLGHLLAVPAYSQVTAITNVRIVDVDSGVVSEPQTLIITDDRITAIEPEASVDIPTGATMIDADGKFAIPGLWDMHVHLDDPEMWPHHLTRDRKEAHLQLLVANGVTGVRDMGGGFDQILKWKHQISAGELLGPSIILAGPIVDGEPALWLGSAAVGDPDTGREVVRSLVNRGADFIKAYSMLEPEVFLAIVDEAQKLGVQVAGHLPIRVSPVDASNAGMNSIEHIIGLTYACSSTASSLRQSMDNVSLNQGYPWGIYLGSDERVRSTFDVANCSSMIETFAANDTWQVPTLRTLWGLSSRALDDHPELNRYVHASHIKNWRENRTPDPQLAAVRTQALDQNMQLTKAMHEAGVGIMAGTDMAALPYTYPGFSLHNELELFVEAGLSPLEALQTATINPARFLRQEDSRGRVRTGLIADIVLLDENPIDDIANTQKISVVVTGGMVLLRPQLDEILNDVADTMR
ncbi:MAG: amidohydrolase family protein [Rhodothermales bacterium]|nr:amidohydrolase family protein [Rhodothermales bacterium]